MDASVPPSAWAEPQRRRSTDKKTRRSARRTGNRLAVVPATPADYAGIHHFLTAVFQGPSREEFRASLDDPFHEPHDRLLVKRGSDILAHVHLTRRMMQFGSLQIPVSGLASLGAMPELRGQGYGRRLLLEAEQQMAAEGAVLGLLWTGIPHFFRRTGWALCGRPCRRRAPVRDVLAGLETLGLCHRKGKRLNIRPWRRMELGALVRIYAQNLLPSFGPFERTEAYWRWLISRKAYDQLYVALDGPNLLELEEDRAPIVGYAITHGEAIIELFTAPGRRAAAVQLLVRACSDAIERGDHTITLHAPAGSRLDKLFRKTGGKRPRRRSGKTKVLMAKLIDPVKFLRATGDELHRRAEAAGLPRPVQLGLLVDGKKYHLTITRHGITPTARNIGRSYLRLNVADFTRLVLGHLDWKRALAAGRVEASTQTALKTAHALFPPLPFWRPPLDELSV